MKKKISLLFIIAGCIFTIISIIGFYTLSDIKGTISKYGGSDDLFKNVQNHDSGKYYDTYWDYLKTNDCQGTLTTCYCDHVDNEKDSLNQFLNDGGGKYNDVSSLTVSVIKYRYIWIIVALISYICAWVFYSRKNIKNLEVKKAN